MEEYEPEEQKPIENLERRRPPPRPGRPVQGRRSPENREPAAFPALQRREHVIALARGHAEAGDVDQQFFGGFPEVLCVLARLADSRSELC